MAHQKKNPQAKRPDKSLKTEKLRQSARASAMQTPRGPNPQAKRGKARKNPQAKRPDKQNPQRSRKS